MKLIALVLLLSTFFSLTLMEVVEDVQQWKSECGKFFIKNPRNQNDIIYPTIFPGCQYKMICQRWKQEYRFATVYDTVRRIPVYSAYTFFKGNKTRRNKTWKVEPQLEYIDGEREMKVSPKEAGNIIQQAVSSDYTNSNYTRGHVFPRFYAADQDQADSTFTLTNIAPQSGSSNGNWAKEVEEPMRKEINDECMLNEIHPAYIVTGVVPGNKWIPITRKNRTIEYKEGINVPSHYWSAFCCTNKTDITKLVLKAYIAKQERFNVQLLSIDELNNLLTELYGQRFHVFPGLAERTSLLKLFYFKLKNYIKTALFL